MRSPITRLLIVLLALAAPSLWAQDGLRGALERREANTQLLRDSLGQGVAAADFDRDQEPDGALLLHADSGRPGFRIELHVTAGVNRELTFESNETALSISVRDLNRDGTPDIVVEQIFTHKRVAIWLNDGHGSFNTAKSEDFPSETESPGSLKSLCPAVDSLPPYLASRWNSDYAIQGSLASRQNTDSQPWSFWLKLHTVADGPRAPDSARAPPRFLSL